MFEKFIVIKTITKDKWGLFGFYCIIFYFLIATAVWLGALGNNWSQISDSYHSQPSLKHLAGTNAIGQDILSRAIYSTKVAFQIGIIVTFFSALFGMAVGTLSGYYRGSWVDRLSLWLMATIDSIPFYLLIAAIAYAFKGSSYAMYLSMILIFWTTTARLIRAEVITLKKHTFIEAAQNLGLKESRIIITHILPNTSHLLLIQSTLIFVSAIKTEVILSFLGIGIQNGISWGLMISEAKNDILAGYYGNLITASIFLFLLVMAFNLFADALQDALSPKSDSTL